MDKPFNFDEILCRKGTGAVKWDALDRQEGQDDVIPLWVADMDFPSPPDLVEALKNRAAHPVYGYTGASSAFYESLLSWYHQQYHLTLESNDLLIGPGTVPSLGIAIRALSAPGDGVLIFTPVYHPFFDMIRQNNRQVVEAPMDLNGRGRYGFRRETAEQALAAARERGLSVPLALFCSPHNPGGSVWEKAELEMLLDFAAERGITVISDEIHGDFVYPPKSFTSLAALGAYADRAVVISGANKSFNLGGLHVSHFVVRDENLKQSLKAGLKALAFHQGDIFSMIAAETAYRGGASWLAALKIYIRRNIEEAVRYLNAEVPGIRAYEPEGTYLIWADATELIARLGLEDDVEFTGGLEREGRVKLTPGSAFGSRGKGFVRINTACPRPQLLEGLRRIKDWQGRKKR
ncbi:MAG: pyridoxal phosphate-dependent aminotransferase [Spirochaetaceae bacterium]|nr:pyridoxal phosphate-dependent aminotransferase [Spirochaetaceae bacterium]